MAVRRSAILLRAVAPLLLLAVLVLFLVGATPALGSKRTFYPDCGSAPHFKPHRIVVFCADAGVYINHINWTRWGRRSARGRSSRAFANDCDPACAGGHFHRYSARLDLFRRRTCRNITIFTRMRVTFLGKRKPDGPRKFIQPLNTNPLCTCIYVRARENGSVRALGPFHPNRNPRYSAAVRALGEPDSEREFDGGNACRVRWEFEYGLTIWFANFAGQSACDRRYGFAQSALIKRPLADGWLTSRGLYIGDKERRLRKLYRNATHHGRSWWLVTGRTPIGCTRPNGCPYPVLRATIRHHKVFAFSVWIGAAGE